MASSDGVLSVVHSGVVCNTTLSGIRSANAAQLEETWEAFFEAFPRDPAIRAAQQKCWVPTPGDEYLVANPISIPGLSKLLDRSFIQNSAEQKVNGAVSGLKPVPARRSPSPESDPFVRLPTEISDIVLCYLTSREIAALRTASPYGFPQRPVTLFRRLVLEEMPWLWEAQDLPVSRTDWWTLWVSIKGEEGRNLKGLKNRRRVWKDVEEIVERIRQRRENGEIVD